jgi:hypothetical protein
MLMLVILPSRCSCLHLSARGCAAMTYSSGLRGLPCAHPEGMLNTLLLWPPLNTICPMVSSSSKRTQRLLL